MDALTSTEQPIVPRTLHVRCCIVGGGPAGMMLGYLLGRAGVETLVLEKHADFFRDFRGDTVHPSTLQVMDELGLIDGFLKLPHQQLQKMDGIFGDEPIRIADLCRLKMKYPFVAFMPQWDFLNFLRESGRRFSSLKVMMNANATDLVWSGDRVAGVNAEHTAGTCRDPRRPHGRLRRPALGHARARKARGPGDRCADGCPVVSRGQAGRRERKPFCKASSRQNARHLRPRRLLAMRLRDSQRAA